MIKEVSKYEFDSIVNIKFNNILDGYNKYEVIELYPKDNLNQGEDLYLDFFKLLFNKDRALIIDFYKKNLTVDSINIIKEILTVEEKHLLDNILNIGSEDSIYLEIIDEKYLSLLVKLNTRELFFITFYFYKSNITIWGNYNMKFPLFYKDKNEYNYYASIAKNKNLL